MHLALFSIRERILGSYLAAMHGQGAPRPVAPHITEASRIHAVLFAMQNMIFGP
jgi:hypothetical protein